MKTPEGPVPLHPELQQPGQKVRAWTKPNKSPAWRAVRGHCRMQTLDGDILSNEEVKLV